VIRFVRIFAYVLGGFFSVLFFFNLRKYVAQNSGICTHILFDNKICYVLILTKTGWASLTAIFSRTHLVTLGGGGQPFVLH
jgi:hypothetical protein